MKTTQELVDEWLAKGNTITRLPTSTWYEGNPIPNKFVKKAGRPKVATANAFKPGGKLS